MSKTRQEDGNPIAARLEPDNEDGPLRRVIPFHAIADYAGREGRVAQFGGIVTGAELADLSVVFDYFIDPKQVIIETTGGGTASVVASRMKLEVLAGAPGTVKATSVQRTVYRPGHELTSLFESAFTEGAPGITQQAGIYDDNDGYFVSVNDQNELEANLLLSGVLFNVNRNDFNIDRLDGAGPSKFNINLQSLLVYRISYAYLDTILEVYGGFKTGWIPFHTFDTTNIVPSLIVDSPNLPIRFEISSDGSTDVKLFTASWLAGSVGVQRERVINDHFAFGTTRTLTGNVEVYVGTMRVKSIFQGRPNKIPVDMRNVTAGVAGPQPHIFRIYKNVPIIGAVWEDPLGPNSVIEIDLTATLDGPPPPDTIAWAGTVGKDGDLGPGHDFEAGELRLVPGEYMTFTAETQGNSEVTMAGQWDELK